MKITAEMKKILNKADVEISRDVYEEDNDYGDKAGDVSWPVWMNGRSISDPCGKRWIAQEEAMTLASTTLRNRGEAITPDMAAWLPRH